MAKIYLAVPYTWNPEASFKIANQVTAQLMEAGHVVFSPISHSHYVADFLDPKLRTDSDWWMEQDLPFVEWCDEVYVLMIGETGDALIARSKGVQMELQHAKKIRKPIVYIDFYE